MSFASSFEDRVNQGLGGYQGITGNTDTTSTKSTAVGYDPYSWLNRSQPTQYYGTKDGQAFTFTQDNIGDADAGSIAGSNMQFDQGSDFGMDSVLGIGKIGVGLGNLALGYENLGLAKDTFDFNKMAADREYAANVQKYDNTLARTAAIDKHYGSQTAGQKIG